MHKYWPLLVVGLMLLAGGGVVVYNKTRGLRNNNPGNIVHGEKWTGMSTVQSDPDFVSFVSPEYGIRALYRNLMSYRKAGLQTVKGIINRWAPQFDRNGKQINDTPAYIAAVSKEVGYMSDNILPLTAYPSLVRAIIRHENGVQPYHNDVILRGISLA